MLEKLIYNISPRKEIGNKEFSSSLNKRLQSWPKWNFRLNKYLKFLKKKTILVSECLGLNPNSYISMLFPHKQITEIRLDVFISEVGIMKTPAWESFARAKYICLAKTFIWVYSVPWMSFFCQSRIRFELKKVTHKWPNTYPLGMLRWRQVNSTINTCPNLWTKSHRW